HLGAPGAAVLQAGQEHPGAVRDAVLPSQAARPARPRGPCAGSGRPHLTDTVHRRCAPALSTAAAHRRCPGRVATRGRGPAPRPPTNSDVDVDLDTLDERTREA